MMSPAARWFDDATPEARMQLVEHQLRREEDQRAADVDDAMAKMCQIAAVRNGPSKGVRRRTDKLPADVKRNGTRWGFVPKELRIGPPGWGRPA